MNKQISLNRKEKTPPLDAGHRKIPRYLRQAIIGAFLGTLVGLAVTGIFLLGSLNQYQARFEDVFYQAGTPTDQLVVVLIDDKSVEDYGWPLERFVLGGFVRAVSLAQPKVIALDFILPDPASQEDVIAANSLIRASKLVQPVLGIEATRYPSSVSRFPAFDSVLLPAPTLRTPNTNLAHAMIYPDSDGIVRRIPLAIDSPGVRHPSFALATVAISRGLDPSAIVQANSIIVDDHPVPIDAQGQMLINFVNPRGLKRISFSDFVQGKVDLAIFHDKIVVVGPATSNAMHENYLVPASVGNSPQFNVEIQASVMDTLIRGRFLHEEDRASQIVMILAIALFAGVTLVHLARFYAGALTLLYFAAYLFYGFRQFDGGIIVTPLYPALTLVLIFSLAMLYRYFSRERTRAQIARMFLGSVAPESVNEILAIYDQGGLSLTGGRREVSVLSIALRGLSRLSEASAPEAVIQAMGLYTARIFEIVFQHGGSMHSQVGNTIIAMWNLPLVQPDHARLAVQAAFEIQAAIIKLNAETTGLGLVESGLGVATGPVVAGQLSASSHGGYSVIGDVVNLAERLGILASENQVYVDPETHGQLGEEFVSRVVHTLRLRGRKDPVQVWELRPIPSTSRVLAS